MTFIISKIPSLVNIAVQAAETSSNRINWALNIVQKITKISTTAIDVLRSNIHLNKFLPLASKLDASFYTAIKMNQLCGLIELPIVVCSVAKAIWNELRLLRNGLTSTQIFAQLRNKLENNSINEKEFHELSWLMHKSASCGDQYSIFTSIPYILVRIAECIRPLNNAMDFLEGRIYIPEKFSTLSHKWMGPSLIFTSTYLAFRVLNNEILFEYESPIRQRSYNQYYLDFLSSISRIAVGIFMTMHYFSKKQQSYALNLSIMTYFGFEALSFAHRKYHNCFRPKRESVNMLSNPF